MGENKVCEANRIILFVNILLDLALIGGYIGEVIKGQKSMAFVVTFILTILITLISSIVLYIRDKAHPLIKYTVIYGFSVVYIIAMFTSERILTYTYMLVLLVLYFMYLDYKLITRLVIGTVGINALRILYMYFGLGLNSSSMTTDYTIQFFSVLLIGVGLIGATRFSIKNTNQEIEAVKSAQRAQEETMNKVLEIGKLLDSHCGIVYQTIESLESASEMISEAINEISTATQESTIGIERQKELTQEIDKVIQTTTKASEDMLQISGEAVKSTRAGEVVVHALNENTKQFNEVSDKVYQSVEVLSSRATEIEGILECISNIAKQTNILSLNATIESARVGELGKGFAVVAGEVKQLAEQTTDETNNISNIIMALQSEIKESLEQIKAFKEISNEQGKLIEKTADLFYHTTQDVQQCEQNVKEVANKMETISLSNRAIIERIEDISTKSEETMMGAEEAAATSQENKDKASQTKELAKELVELSEQLKEYI